MSDDLKAEYPNVQFAVEYGERPDNLRVWEEARKIGVAPDRIVMLMKLAARLAVASRYPPPSVIPPDALVRYQRIMREFDHPEFLSYVCGKLGAV